MKHQYNRREFLGTLGALTLCNVVGNAAFALPSGKNDSIRFPDWKEGWMDIHHISTGMGNSTFIICPDGTSLLIDAGSRDNTTNYARTMPPLPNGKQSSGEWIAGYISRYSKPLKQAKPTLDYVLLTHFHRDHIGAKLETTPEAHGYALAGISMLAEQVGIRKIVDRGWPDYDFPSRKAIEDCNSSFFNEYLKFIEYQQKTRKTLMEGFDIGSRSQFVLQHKPGKYKDFSIRNICANGKVWTGDGTNTKVLFPDTAKPDENMCSCVVKMTYGAFNYYSGGDSIGAEGRDLETSVSDVVGSVDAMIMNHHGQKDASNAHFLGKLQPHVMVIPAWDLPEHPHPLALSRMCDKSIYPDERSIFSTGTFKGVEEKPGEAEAIKSWGHVVIRVYEKGRKYKIFVLDSASENFEVKYSTDFLSSKNIKRKI